MKEREIIENIRKTFPDAGIGDDAAILPAGDGGLLLAADAVVEGVHFRREYSTLRQAVEKVVTSNVSDIYAMGGEPGSALLTAGLPEGFSGDELAEITDGLQSACEIYGLRLAGGDTVLSPSAVFFNVAILGSVGAGCAVPRSGAREGDALVLFGECGRSLAGMHLLAGLLGTGEAGIPIHETLTRNGPEREAVLALIPKLTTSTESDEIELLLEGAGVGKETLLAVNCMKQHLTPLARPLLPQLLGSDPPVVTSMIDVSDGLATDLRNICTASGVGAVIHEAALPVPREIAALFPGNEELWRRLVLASGEEYVMLGTVRGGGPAGEGAAQAGERDDRPDVGDAQAGERDDRAGVGDAQAGVQAGSYPGGTVIGSIIPAAEGIILERRDGTREALPELGYEHRF
ncbi:MAG: thiamine-monophosphate kinase [bacterium]|nr:MAG: thiamine-monophosphate kinase [bacterium]